MLNREEMDVLKSEGRGGGREVDDMRYFIDSGH